MVNYDNIKAYFFNPVYDRCPIVVTATDGDIITLTTSKSDSTFADDYIDETRTAYNSKAVFDLSPYVKSKIEAELNLPLFLTSKDYWAVAALGIHQYYEKIALADGTSTSLTMLPLLATLGPGESMIKRRVHMYNSNFPFRVSLIYVNNTIVKVDGTQTTGGLKYTTIKNVSDGIKVIEGYMDLDGYRSKSFTMTMSNCINPIGETNVSSTELTDVTNWVEWLGTREDHYIYDCKTEGVCLRFLDHFGFIQNLVLDVASVERTTSESVSKAYMQESNRVNDYGFVYGAGEHVDKSTAEVIKAGLNDVTEDLYSDVCDLVTSPCVMMYRDGLWQKTRVTCNSIKLNKKEHKMDVDINVYTLPINTLR